MMATSPEPAGSPGRRVSRWLILVLLLAVAGLAISTPALAATTAAAATTAPTATTAPAATTATTANLTPAAPGGVCQVPGIGDIGGLVGLCAQGSSGIVGSLNNICEPSLPQPEQATGGIDAMIEPPATAAGGQDLGFFL